MTDTHPTRHGILIAAALLLALAAFFVADADTPRVAEAVPVVGDNSCQGPDPCLGLGADAVIGDNSCNGDLLTCVVLSGTVGDNSCNGTHTCADGVDGNVGNDSCNGDFACHGPFTGEVGDGSCNAIDACLANSGTIGSYSCNDTDACQSNSGVIGDCMFNDVDPPECSEISFSVSKTASPSHVERTRTTVEFTVEVTNLDFSSIQLTSLVDDVYGDVDGQGSCSLPQTINLGDSYKCSFTEKFQVKGPRDTATHTDTVSATAIDPQENEDTQTASATVKVTYVPPEYPATATASPTPTLTPTQVATATPEPVETPGPEGGLAGVGDIRPPSTGDGGLLR